MMELSFKIYDRLRETLETGKMVKMVELEKICGVKERGLQAEHGNPGPLDVARDEIYAEQGVVLITKTGRAGGAMLTRDPDEVLAARTQLMRHCFHEKTKADALAKIFKSMAGGQLELEILDEPSEGAT